MFSPSFPKVVLLFNFMIPPFDLKSFHFLGMINLCNLVTRASHGPAIVGCSWLKKRHVLVALLTKLPVNSLCMCILIRGSHKSLLRDVKCSGNMKSLFYIFDHYTYIFLLKIKGPKKKKVYKRTSCLLFSMHNQQMLVVNPRGWFSWLRLWGLLPQVSS